jgi:hypothetical protein
MMVERCPTWKLFTMFGEYSITTFLPAPDVFVLYSGLPDGASYVSSCTCVSTAQKSYGILSIECECLVVRDRLYEIVRLDLRHSTT